MPTLDEPSHESVVVRVERLCKSYTLGPQRVPVLHELSISVARGEWLAIVGASGSGKSTLLNVLGLLDGYEAGHYWLSGRDTRALTEPVAAGLRNRLIERGGQSRR